MAVYDRILRVLASFDEVHTSRSLSEISQSVGIPISTTHRLLAQLTDWGALQRDDERRYVIGTRMFEIGMKAPRASRHRGVLAPVLHELYGVTREHVAFSILDAGTALVTESIPGRDPSIATPVGDRLPLAGSSPGLVMLAFGRSGSGSASAADASSGRRLDAETKAQIREIRRTSVAIGRGGGAPTVAISSPVFESDDRFLGAVTLVVPIGSLDLRGLAERVLRASRTMTRALADEHDWTSSPHARNVAV